MTPAETKIYEKYVKVVNLSTSGVSGERDNAKRIKLKMERENAWLVSEHARQSAPPPPPPPPSPKPEAEPKKPKREASPKPSPSSETTPPPRQSEGGRTVIDWEKIFNFAKDVVGQAEDFVDTVSQASFGNDLAESATIRSKLTPSGKLNIVVSIPPEVLDMLSECNDMQLLAFRNTLVQAFAAEMGAILDLGDE